MSDGTTRAVRCAHAGGPSRQGRAGNQTSCISDDGALSGGLTQTSIGVREEVCGARATARRATRLAVA
ncbi:hypothetical protein [Sorangium sp. So ce426]|uniref:hypothetical protein n=1 Tax=unclassified Sorangium TaxID=2621164 RepID=UPI003F5B0B7B